MTVTLMVTLALQGMVFGLFCAFIAKSKNRNMVGWFYLGFLFSIVALIALVGVPALNQSENPSSRKSYGIISFWVVLILLISGVAFAWQNLWLPDSVYQVIPSPTYKLKVLLSDFNAANDRLQSQYNQASGRGKYYNMQEQIDLVDKTIESINSIDGLDEQTRFGHVASFTKLKLSMLELKGLLDQNYRY